MIRVRKVGWARSGQCQPGEYSARPVLPHLPLPTFLLLIILFQSYQPYLSKGRCEGGLVGGEVTPPVPSHPMEASGREGQWGGREGAAEGKGTGSEVSGSKVSSKVRRERT